MKKYIIVIYKNILQNSDLKNKNNYKYNNYSINEKLFALIDIELLYCLKIHFDNIFIYYINNINNINKIQNIV